MNAFVRAALLTEIWRFACSVSLLRPTYSAGLRPTHLLPSVGELWIFFPPSPFTQWQRGEVLWGLGANELTLQCWGDARWNARGKKVRGGRCWGTRHVRGAIMTDTLGLRDWNGALKLRYMSLKPTVLPNSLIENDIAKCHSQPDFFPFCPRRTCVVKTKSSYWNSLFIHPYIICTSNTLTQQTPKKWESF